MSNKEKMTNKKALQFAIQAIGDTNPEVSEKLQKMIDQLDKKNAAPRKKTAQQICQNTFWDACRYTNSPKYAYKNKFCGKEHDTWDTIFMVLSIALVITFFATVWAITKLI